MQLRMQLLTSCTCSTDATAHATAHATARCTQLITQLLTSGTCSVDATRTCSVDATATCSEDATAHCMQAEDCVDRGLPSVRSARGLQGRQELGRMLVCVTDFVLRLGALGQLLRETSKRG